MYIPYSGLFLWMRLFVESWRWLLDIIFVVLNFVATSECADMCSQIIETRAIIMNADCVRMDVGSCSVESCVRHYHVYRDNILLTASIGEELSTRKL